MTRSPHCAAKLEITVIYFLDFLVGFPSMSVHDGNNAKYLDIEVCHLYTICQNTDLLYFTE